MRFDLDKPLTDEILFYMENQNGDFLFDSQTSKIIKAETDGNYDKTRYIPLPKWDSNDGFRLMEKFTAELKNPVVRFELSAALNVKRGVFRSFKNALDQYPEAEKMWRNYKNKKMRDDISEWYNALREEWGLEPVGGEPSDAGSEDVSDIVLEDFIFREGSGGDSRDGLFLTAETAGGDFCGGIKAVNEGGYLRITSLEVKPEYRGMGVGKTLLSKFLEKAEGQGVIFDLPSDSEFFSRVLHIEGFKPVMRRFVKE